MSICLNVKIANNRLGGDVEKAVAEHVPLDLGLDPSTACSYLYWKKADDSL